MRSQRRLGTLNSASVSKLPPEGGWGTRGRGGAGESSRGRPGILMDSFESAVCHNALSVPGHNAPRRPATIGPWILEPPRDPVCVRNAYCIECGGFLPHNGRSESRPSRLRDVGPIRPRCGRGNSTFVKGLAGAKVQWPRQLKTLNSVTITLIPESKIFGASNRPLSPPPYWSLYSIHG